MKTSMCLLSLLLISDLSAAYDYVLKSRTVTVELDPGTGVYQTILTKELDAPMAFASWKKYVTFREGNITLTAHHGLTTTKPEILDFGTFLYRTYSKDSYVGWDMSSGDIKEASPVFKWVDDAGDQKIRQHVSCAVAQGFHTTKTLGGVYEPKFMALLTLGQTGQPDMTYRFTCGAIYEAVSKLSLRIDQENMKLTGTAGRVIDVTNSVIINSDPGVVQLTIHNSQRNAITVSFVRERETLTTTKSITNANEIRLPLYVSTLNTAPGTKEYVVNIGAELL
ncbi:TPA: hypothetical protein JS362_004707 [Escherichia coli]|nr:hypothetical protein [Escherichia coli]